MKILSLFFLFNLFSIGNDLIAQKNLIIKFDDCEIILGDTINCTENGIKTGYWIIYQPAPTIFYEGKDPNESKYEYFIAEGKYSQGLQTGLWKYYYLTMQYRTYGQEQFVRRTTFYKAGIKDSTETYYYDSTSVKSTIYWSDGVIDSLIVFYPDGNVKCKAIFRNSNVEEFWIFYSDSKLKYHGKEIEEFKVRKLEYFDSSGSVLAPKSYMLPDITVDEELIEFL